MTTTTKILIGDRAVVECGPVRAPFAARDARVFFDGEPVAGVREVGIDLFCADVGKRWIVLLSFPQREAPASFVAYMRRHGWAVLVHEIGKMHDVPISDRHARKPVLDRAWVAWFFAGDETLRAQRGQRL